MVNGCAIGGGHVLHVLCDLTIAADTARFGQVGPEGGLASIRASARRISRASSARRRRARSGTSAGSTRAQEALAMGLVNAVVPGRGAARRDRAWCRELLEKSPTALKLAKQSFNADTEQRAGVAEFACTALELYYETARGHGGAQRVRGEAAGELREVQDVGIGEPVLAQREPRELSRSLGDRRGPTRPPSSTGAAATRMRRSRGPSSESPTDSVPTASRPAAPSRACFPTGASASSCSSRRAGSGPSINPIPPTYRASELRFMVNLLESRVMVIPEVFRGFRYTDMLADASPRAAAPSSTCSWREARRAWACCPGACSPMPPGRRGRAGRRFRAVTRAASTRWSSPPGRRASPRA